MATIKISTGLAQLLCNTRGILENSTSAAAPAFERIVVADNPSASRIRIMSGPVPTQNEIEDAYETWDRATGSPTEILIEHQTRVSTYFSAANGIVSWGLVSVVASTSGVASWWSWQGNGDYDPTYKDGVAGAPNTDRLAIIIGDITVPGGGGTMTLENLNIVAGQSYDIGPANFTLPRTYTYV